MTVVVGVRFPSFRLSAALQCPVGADTVAFAVDRGAGRRVVEATDAAAAAGVWAGMPLREATRLLPRALVVLDDSARTQRAWRRALDALGVMPVCGIDDDGPGFACLRVPRTDPPERWFRRVRARLALFGAAVRCGAGTNRFIALVATYRPADTVCPPGCEAAFVADAPLELLGLDGAVALRLRLLGVRTLGQLAALPPSYLAQFAPDALRWQALASGCEPPAEAKPHCGRVRERPADEGASAP